MDTGPLYTGIGLSAEARRFAEEHPLSDGEYFEWRDLFYKDLDGFLRQFSARSDSCGDFLRLSLRLALDCYREYKKRDISDQIYYDTFSDISIWEREYRQKTGRPGVAEFGWLSNHLSLGIFRLGRLQFEPIALREAIVLDGFSFPAGQLALNVHIPKDGPLLPADTEKSYCMAESFFRGIPSLYLCTSWLLSPALEQMLPPTSNILAFQREFQIVRLLPESRQAEERIFGQVLEEPASYPEETSLQRAAKRRLLSGEKLASAFGVRLPRNNA